MYFPAILDVTFFYLVSLASMSFVGYGLVVLLADHRLRRYLYIVSPLIGFCFTAVLSSFLNSTFLNMQQATWVILGLSASLNIYAIYKGGLERPKLSLDTVVIAALSVLTYAICSLPLIKHGSTTFVGLQWDLELYLPITEYLKRYVVTEAIVGPSNPLLESLNTPAFRGGSGWGFSYVEAFIGNILSWRSFETFRPMLHFTVSLSIPSLYLFSRTVFGMSRSASLLAAALWSINGLPVWIASIGLAGHTVSFFALPLVLTALWTCIDKGPGKSTIPVSLVISALILSFYTGATPLVALSAGAIVLYKAATTASRLLLATRAVAIIAVVLVMAFFGHLRFLEVLPLYFQQGFSSGWHYTAYTSPAELLGLYPYAGVTERATFEELLAPSLSGLADRLVRTALIASLIVCLCSLLARDWERKTLFVLGIPYLAFLLYLRFISEYPYGFFKAASLGYFLLIPLMAQGLIFLLGQGGVASFMPRSIGNLFNMRNRLFFKWGLGSAYLALTGPLIVANLALSVFYFWHPDPHELPETVWQFEAIQKLVAPGEKVYLPDSRGYDKRIVGMLSYFLIDNPLVGQIETAYGEMRSGKWDERYSYLLFPSAEVAAERGLGKEDLLWESDLVGLYRAPDRWLATLDIENTEDGPFRLDEDSPIVLELQQDKWLVKLRDRTFESPYWEQGNWQQAEFSFLSFGGLPINIDVDGRKSTISPGAGPFTYRTDTLILPSVVTIQSNDADTSLWLRSMRISHPVGDGPSLVRSDRFMALAMSQDRLNGRSEVAIEFAARDSKGGDLVIAAELYSIGPSGGPSTPLYYKEIARVHTNGSSRTYIDPGMYDHGADGNSSISEDPYEGHLAVYYVNQELARWRLASFDPSGGKTREYADGMDYPFMLYYLPPLKDLNSLREIVPAGSEMLLSTLHHPDRSFIRVASSGLDHLRLYADPPLARAGNVMPAALGRVYDYALLDVDEDPESYGYSEDGLLWENEETALYKRGGDGPKALFRFGIGVSEAPSLSSGGSINIDISNDKTVIVTSNGQLYQADGAGPGKAQLELLLATQEDRVVVVEHNGIERPLMMRPGVLLYRSEPLPVAASVVIRSDGPVAVLAARIGNLGEPVVDAISNSMAVSMVSNLERGGEAVADITYYGPKDRATSIGIDIYSTNDNHHYGWWATLTEPIKNKMQISLDLVAQKGRLVISEETESDLLSESWPAPNGSYRAFLQVKREEKYYMVSAFDFSVEDGEVKSFRPLKVDHVLPGS